MLDKYGTICYDIMGKCNLIRPGKDLKMPGQRFAHEMPGQNFWETYFK